MSNDEIVSDQYYGVGKFFLDVVEVIAKRKKFFVSFIGGMTICAIIVSLLLPKWYKATASVFPAENTDVLGALAGASSLVKSLSIGSRFSSLGGPNEIDRYKAILKSERALMQVIDKFDLVKEYGFSTYVREKTLKELVSNVEIEETDEGSLEISVYDKNPEKAAQMANYFVEQLNEINSEMKAQNARANRIYIEQRYKQTLDDIELAQKVMRNFQEKNGVIAVPEQIEASVKVGAEILAQLTLKEIEFSVLERTYSENHPDVLTKQIEVQELRKKIIAMNSQSMMSNDMNILLPMKKAPELASQYLTFYRDLQIQSKVLEFIAPLYEQSKVEEKRETPSVIVLDKAAIPERKAKPKIVLFALLAFVGSSILGLIVVFSLEGLERLSTSNPDQYERIVSSLKSNWRTK